VPNLKLAQDLRETYGITSGGTIAKSFSAYQTDSIANPRLSAAVLGAFERKQRSRVTLAFIDVTGFSVRTAELSAEDIVQILETYYETLIPMIYERGGEVEKVMGDGVIAVFGEPFIDSDGMREADRCCMKAIETFYGSDLEVKCAVHPGEVIYYPIGVDPYEEYTMIGPAMTELYRLESVCRKNAIGFYSGTPYDTMQMADVEWSKDGDGPRAWVLSKGVAVNLPGVNRDEMRFLRYSRR